MQELRNRIIEIKEKHREQVLLFVIDAVDEAGPAEKALISFLQSEFPKLIRLIVTARPGHVSFPPSSVSGRSNQLVDLDNPDLGLNHQSDVRLFVTSIMPSLELDAVNEVVRLSNGNFLVSRGICHELRDVPTAEIAHTLRELSALKPIDLQTELYQRTWKRLERLDADLLDTIEKVALLLVNAPVPLSVQIIRDTLGLRHADWVQIQQRFGEYLKPSQQPPQFERDPIDTKGAVKSASADESVTAFRLFHQSFEVFVRMHLKEDLADSNSRLADYCGKNLKKRNRSYEYAYALRFGPYHLLRATEDNPQRWSDLEELLTDISFLEAKTQAGLVFELAADFLSAWQAMPADRPMRAIIKLLEEAVRREIHFVAQHAADYPQGLFQCLWNVGWWCGNERAVPYYGYFDAPQQRPPPGHSLVGNELVQLLERWHNQKQLAQPGFYWLRSCRPPDVPLGEGQKSFISLSHGGGPWVACSGDGKRIAGGGDSSLRVWNADTLVEIAQMPEWEGQGHPFQAAALSSDSNFVIAAYGEINEDEEVAIDADCSPLLTVWDIKRVEVKLVPHRHTGVISDIRFSPDGSRFATASWDQTIRIWDAKTLNEILVLDGCEGRVDSLCYSPDSKRIVAGADAIRIWDAVSGRAISVFPKSESEGEDEETNNCVVCFSPDGKRIATYLARLLPYPPSHQP